MTLGQLQAQVGRNIRRLRTARGLSQEAFGHEIGFHRTYVGGVERGERNLTLRTVERMADVLDVPAAELILEDPSAD